MADATRNAFGRLLVRPETLEFHERVACLRRLAGELQAGGATLEAQWLGRGLVTWLQHGGDLLKHLDLRPPQGCRITAQALVRQAAVDDLLLRASNALGSDRRAADVIAERSTCPPQHLQLVCELRALGAPKSADAIGDARRRVVARHRA